MRWFVIGAALLASCGQIPQRQPESTSVPVVAPPDQAALTDWHRQPVFEKLWSRNVVLYNHADASLRGDRILDLLQAQYDFLLDYVGLGPDWILVHVGNDYPNGFAIGASPYPEMFLQAGRIFDTQHDYAHEMMHCFTFQFGDLPHWFNESTADIAYVDAEIEHYRRRKEAPFLEQFDRVGFSMQKASMERSIFFSLRRRKSANTCSARLFSPP